jgi:uncharacterized membrane protein YfcA
MDFSYWYVFPVAVLVSVIANASGFSGSVLFQPFFNFVLRVPLSQSIAKGIATETIGMSSGAYRYFKMGMVDWRAVLKVLPFVVVGVVSGIFVFIKLQIGLRLIVGVVIFGIASYQLYLAWRGEREGKGQLTSNFNRLRQYCAGVFSACTGTGVAEMHQPMLESVGLNTKNANATAIMVEALADWGITVVNLSIGNLRYDILLFSVSGVMLGAQLGAIISPRLPSALLKCVFGLSVSAIGLIYVFT